MHSSQTNPLVRPSSASVAPVKKRRSMVPPLWLWIVLALALVVGVVLRTTDILDEPGFTNMGCMALAMLTALIVLVWFFFLSGFGLWGKLAGLIGLAVLGALFVTVYEIRGPTGNMLLEIVRRDLAPHDTTLEVPTLAGPTVDLLTTTPNDFAQFLGPTRSAGVDHVKLSRDWSSKPPELLWKERIGAGWSAFAVVNGYAVTLEQRGDKEMITCYEVKSGKMCWNHAHTARYEFFLAGTGPRSTPTIHQGKVYALGATGVLFCLDGANGKEIWKKDLLQEFGITAEQEFKNLMFGRSNSPLIVNELVIVPAGGPSENEGVSLVAYHKDTGAKVWTGGKQQISYSSPVLTKLGNVEQVLIVNETWVSGHDPASGKVLWEFYWKGDSSEDANSSQAVPVAPDKVFVSKGYRQGAGLYQLKPKGDGTFEPQQLWHNDKVLRTKFTNVAIHDGFAYGLSDGLALECVDLKTGKSQWKDRGDYGHGQILRVGELLLVLGEDGRVFLKEAKSENHEVLGSFQAIEGKTWNNIALYGPYLLVRNGQEAACYQLPVAD